MNAIILAAGHGTDLNPLTTRHPKHLLPIGNRPGLAYAIESLRNSGVQQVAITVNGDEKHYRRVLGDGTGLGVRLSYLHEPTPQGTAGCLRAALRDGMSEPLLVVNANLIFSADLRGLVKAHLERGAAATVGVVRSASTGWPRPQRERVSVGPEGALLGMEVDYGADGDDSEWRAAGIYVFDRRALDRIPERAYYDLKEQFLPALVRAGLPIYAQPITGYLRELNSAEDYLGVHFDFCRGRTGAKPFGEELSEGVWVQGVVDLSPDVLLIGPVVLGPDVRVGSGARLIGPLVIGGGTEIGEGAHLRESVVGEDVRVGARARIERSILAEGLQVAEGTVITESLATGQTLTLGNLTMVERDMRIAVASLPFHRYLRLGVRRRAYLMFKRTFDLLFAAVGLVAALPIMAAVALAIRWDSGGPVLFRQRRCGRDGKDFVMLKFRSMRADADRLQEELRGRNECDGPMFKIADDPRFTRVGRVLRKYSLDELPQLWNVLCGDMSVVGPRPLAERELRVCPSWREARLRVKPGLTGLWQINGRERNAFQDWIRLDLQYVREQSLWRDLTILLRTAAALAKGL